MISSVNSHDQFQDFTGVQNKRQKQSSFDHEIEKSHEKQEAQASTISFQKEVSKAFQFLGYKALLSHPRSRRPHGQ